MKFTFGEISVDADRLELHSSGELIEVQPKVLQVLLYLLRNAERTVPKRELLDGVWPDVATGDSSLTRAISVARRLVGREVIENVRGTGYRIAVSVEHSGPRGAEHLADRGVAGFVGRRIERGTLDRWRGASLAAGFTGLVRGEPGVGKTRLAREFTADARQAGARVVWGSAVEGAPRAYGIWRQLLTTLLDGDAASAARAPRAAVETIAEVIDELRVRRPELRRPFAASLGSSRPRFFSAVAEILRESAASQPLVLLLDDVQWADTGSMRLLEWAIRETAGHRVLWLLLARRNARVEDRPLDEVLTEWRADSSVLELSGLDVETVASLAEQLGAEALSAQRIGELHDRTAGNPLFVEQLVRAGLTAPEAGAPDPAIEREALRGVTHVLRARLEALPEACVRILEVAAVYGREVPIGLLADVLQRDDLDLLDLLEPAERAELIVTRIDASGLAFDHELVREALLGMLGSGARARCHKAIAEALERRLPLEGRAVVPSIAWHYGRCIARTTAKRAVDYALRAAAQEMESLAFESAAGHYRDALRAGERAGVGDERGRGRMWLDLATALFYAGDPIDAERSAWNAIELARRCGDLQVRAEAAVAMSDWVLHRSGQVPEQRVGMLEEVLALLPRDEAPLRARVLMALSQDLHWSPNPSRATELALQAVAAARESGDALVLCHCLAAAFHVLWDPAEPARRDALVDEHVELARRVDDIERRCLAHHHRFAIRIERGDHEGAQRDRSEADAMAERLQRIRYVHASRARAANVATYLGRFDEAEQHCAEADGLRQHRSEDIGFLVGAAQRFTLTRLRGSLESWQTILRAGVVQYPEVKGFAVAACLMSYELGDGDRARSEHAALWRDGEPALARDMQLILNLVNLGQVTAALGNEAQVGRMYELLLPCDGRMAVLEAITTAGSVSRVLALLAHRRGDPASAEGHFDAALRVERSLRAAPWEAYTLRDYGAYLEQCGRADEARAALGRSREIARDLGMPHLAS
jgi:DNA-binding winged helix-turn-helix (wHTH) protein/tetratricopeptide (TPR) repeat protein